MIRADPQTLKGHWIGYIICDFPTDRMTFMYVICDFCTDGMTFIYVICDFHTDRMTNI